jgi:4-diphosphocytidyl-2-C-methyl-D-erythritol kinase
VIPDPTRRLAPVVRLAPAKLNLTLAVAGRRSDGYHDLHSIVVPLRVADRLSVAAGTGRSDTLHVAGPDTGPRAENLVLRAISLAREAVGAGWPGVGRPPPLAARLDKRIPVAAGLGGGSSDAAAALDAALEAWDAELGPQERAGVAARLGSDVPFFLAGGPALVQGRGELVTPLPAMPGDPVGVLLVIPSSTALRDRIGRRQTMRDRKARPTCPGRLRGRPRPPRSSCYPTTKDRWRPVARTCTWRRRRANGS